MRDIAWTEVITLLIGAKRSCSMIWDCRRRTGWRRRRTATTKRVTWAAVKKRWVHSMARVQQVPLMIHSMMMLKVPIHSKSHWSSHWCCVLCSHMSLQGDSGTLKQVEFLRLMMMMMMVKRSNMTLWWELEKVRSVSVGRAFEE
jgi:hypothetical protein